MVSKATQVVGMGMLAAFIGIILVVLGWQQGEDMELLIGVGVIGGGVVYTAFMFSYGGVDVPSGMGLLDYMEFVKEAYDWACEHADDTAEVLREWQEKGYFARFGARFGIDDADANTIIDMLREVEDSGVEEAEE